MWGSAIADDDRSHADRAQQHNDQHFTNVIAVKRWIGDGCARDAKTWVGGVDIVGAGWGCALVG
jgi:hypothetical protein